MVSSGNVQVPLPPREAGKAQGSINWVRLDWCSSMGNDGEGMGCYDGEMLGVGKGYRYEDGKG